MIPVHVIATNLGGTAVCFSSGPAVDAIMASAAIPGAFPSVRIGEDRLMDGAVGSNTPILAGAKYNGTAALRYKRKRVRPSKIAEFGDPYYPALSVSRAFNRGAAKSRKARSLSGKNRPPV